MATQPDKVPHFIAQIATYWNPDVPNSFFQWHNRAAACAEKIRKIRLTAIQDISKAFETPVEKRNLRPILDAKWELFKAITQEIRQLENDMEPAKQLSIDACSTSIRDKTTTLAGDYVSFDKRLDGLIISIDRIYKDSLYPFLLSLQDAESGWNPAGILCTAWDYCAWWKVADATKEVEKVVPKSAIRGNKDGRAARS